MAVNEHGERFIKLLQTLREGRAVNEAGLELERVVEGVALTAGAGNLTLTLKVALQKDSEEIIETVDVVTSKIPEERKDTWWLGPNGTLRRSRPRSNDAGLFQVGEPEDRTGDEGEDQTG